MPPRLHIRPFAPCDQAKVRNLVNAGLGEHFGYVDASYNPDLDNIAAHYPARGHLFVIAEYDGALAGTGALVREDETTGRLVRMSVAPAYRRQGIARALVLRLLAAARERSFTRVVVETNRDWDDAVGLYRACGFEEYTPPSATTPPRLIHLTRDLTARF
jgi:GNAT superfamily N-acetyltransferase